MRTPYPAGHLCPSFSLFPQRSRPLLPLRGGLRISRLSPFHRLWLRHIPSWATLGSPVHQLGPAFIPDPVLPRHDRSGPSSLPHGFATLHLSRSIRSSSLARRIRAGFALQQLVPPRLPFGPHGSGIGAGGRGEGGLTSPFTQKTGLKSPGAMSPLSLPSSLPPDVGLAGPRLIAHAIRVRSIRLAVPPLSFFIGFPSAPLRRGERYLPWGSG